MNQAEGRDSIGQVEGVYRVAQIQSGFYKLLRILNLRKSVKRASSLLVSNNFQN
jgi:hypothetical protein